MRPVLVTLLAAALCAPAAAGDDVDGYLSNTPAAGQPIDAAGSGLHAGAADKKPGADAQGGGAAAGQPQRQDGVSASSSTAQTGDGGLADPTLSKAKMADGTRRADGPSSPGTKVIDALVKIDQQITWTNLYSAPEHVPGTLHAMMPAHLGQNYSVGFLTASDQDFADAQKLSPGRYAFNGRCAAEWSPVVKISSEGCQTNVWVSAAPGGDPVGAHCFHSEETNSDYPAVLNWYVAAAGQEPKARKSMGGYMCELQRAKRYYCNYAPTQAKDRKRPDDCGAIMNAPIGGMDDNIPPRS